AIARRSLAALAHACRAMSASCGWPRRLANARGLAKLGERRRLGSDGPPEPIAPSCPRTVLKKGYWADDKRQRHHGSVACLSAPDRDLYDALGQDRLGRERFGCLREVAAKTLQERPGIIERIANRTCLAEIKRQRIFDHDAISSRPTCFGARTEGRSKGVPRCSRLKARSLCDGGSITQKLRPPQSEVELEFCDDPQIAHALRCQNAADGCRIPASCVSRGIARLRASAPRAIGGPARSTRGCEIQKNPGHRVKGSGVNVSNGSSQSAMKNTASVSAELIANSTTSSLSRARDMICNANAATLFSGPNANA